jgi:hypothetical protein
MREQAGVIQIDFRCPNKPFCKAFNRSPEASPVLLRPRMSL